jgi:hypothetical protein
MKLNLTTFLLVVILFSCNEKKTQSDFQNQKAEVSIKKEDFPGVIEIDSLKETDFVVTMENKFNNSKNFIYTPTILFAWDELKNKLASQKFSTPIKNIEFDLLNNSTSHLNSLSKGEYSIEIKQESEEIEIRTYFQKMLPFEFIMESIDQMLFKNKSVKGFGIKYYDKDLVKNIEIINYENDDDFIVKLIPKDKTNEIILIKGDNNSKTFIQVVERLDVKSSEGLLSQNDSELRWKNEFLYNDILEIPKVKFNISKTFKNLEGVRFNDENNKDHVLTKVFQRNGFVLDENGAKAESEAIIAADTTAISPENLVVKPKPKPKKLIFDKDFYILIKKVNSKNPYFLIRIANTELMEENKKRSDANKQ